MRVKKTNEICHCEGQHTLPFPKMSDLTDFGCVKTSDI